MSELKIRSVNLSPMTFDRLEWSGRQLLIDPPLVLEPTTDEESHQLFYLLADAGLGIDVFAGSREELADELAEQVFFQWDAYARESPERLTRGARRLREAMLARMREVDLASQTENR